MFDLPIPAMTLLAVLGGMAALWLVSLPLRNASIIDSAWGPGFALVTALAYWHGGASTIRGLLALLMVIAWGGRLGLYIFLRNRGHGEDFRYAAMREHHGARFPIVSLFTVFLLQGLLMWFISLPLQAIQLSAGPALGWLDGLAVLIWATGLAFEGIGDWQLARFKADPANKGRVLDRGLWRYTRHPNYFGDFLVWWGFYLLAVSVPWGAATIASPMLMSWLLTRVSGVKMLEATLAQRPRYRDYIERTSAFFPRPPAPENRSSSRLRP